MYLYEYACTLDIVLTMFCTRESRQWRMIRLLWEGHEWKLKGGEMVRLDQHSFLYVMSVQGLDARVLINVREYHYSSSFGTDLI